MCVRTQKVKWAVSGRAKDSRRPLRLAELIPARGYCSAAAWYRTSARQSGNRHAPPQSANATTEDAQLSRVTRNCMVLVVQHNLAKPCTDLGRTMMPPALELGLDGFELRDHSLLRRNPPDDECLVADALPTEVGETQEREGIWFSLSRCSRSRAASRPDSISRVLSTCNSKPNLASRS